MSKLIHLDEVVERYNIMIHTNKYQFSANQLFLTSCRIFPFEFLSRFTQKCIMCRMRSRGCCVCSLLSFCLWAAVFCPSSAMTLKLQCIDVPIAWHSLENMADPRRILQHFHNLKTCLRFERHAWRWMHFLERWWKNFLHSVPKVWEKLLFCIKCPTVSIFTLYTYKIS